MRFVIRPAFAEAASRRQVAVSSPSHRLSEPVADRIRKKSHSALSATQR
jgi:hypothetical protein